MEVMMEIVKLHDDDLQGKDEETMDFVEQSFINIVNFWKDELIEVYKGAKASELFSDGVRQSLVKKGVLKQIFRGLSPSLSDEAKDILGIPQEEVLEEEILDLPKDELFDIPEKEIPREEFLKEDTLDTLEKEIKNVKRVVERQKITQIIINGEIISYNPNNNKSSGKIYNQGGSRVVSVPFNWERLLNFRDIVEKRLIKVKIKKTPLTFIEGYLLIIAEEGFPFELLMKDIDLERGG